MKGDRNLFQDLESYYLSPPQHSEYTPYTASGKIGQQRRDAYSPSFAEASENEVTLPHTHVCVLRYCSSFSGLTHLND